MPRRGTAVHQRKSDGLWLATYELPKDDAGKRVRKYAYGKTMGEAIAKRKAALAAPATDAPVPRAEQSVGELLDYWHEVNTVSGTWKPATVRNYADIIRTTIKPYVLGIRLSALTADDIENMLAALRSKDLSTSTQDRALTILSAALQLAEDREYVRKNVARTVKGPKVTYKEQPTLSAQQAKDLLYYLKGEKNWLEPFYLLAVYTGMRSGELLGLRWVDVDLEAGTLSVTGTLDQVDRVRVTPKTAKSRRTVRLGPEEVQVLQDQRKRQTDNGIQGTGGYVFTSNRGTPVCASTVRRQFRNLCTTLELPAGLHPHDLRHSYAQIALAAGVPLERVSWKMGHADIRITANLYGWNSSDIRDDNAAIAGALR